MNTSEEPLEPSIADGIAGAATEGADLVGVNSDDAPSSVIEAINRYLAESNGTSKRDSDIDNWADRAIPIGSLWGQILVNHLGWHWASLRHDADGSRRIAVVNEDRSLVVFPFHYCFECLESRDTPTVLLAFNMLRDNRVPAQPKGACIDVMQRVQRIVPS